MMTATACPSAEKLKALSLGQLPEDVSDDLFEHVRTCEQCRSDLETIGDGEDSLIASLRMPAEDPEFQHEPDCQLALAKALGALALAHESPAATGVLLPETIGEYEIVRDLGRGGMGAVFLARHTKLGREVALKVLAAHRLAEPRMRERFEAEMRAIGRLSHPNIVTAHDAREVDGLAVLVTEYIDGFDLGQLLQRVGPLAIADACEIARQVAVALDYTCGQGFVHRDIKPSNVMLSKTGDIKLLDLGLARFQLGDGPAPELTGTGQAMGTADYVAPEQISDSRSVDGRSDIYGLGCTLFKLLTGQAPFPDAQYPTAFAKMTAHVSVAAPSLKALRPEAPAGLVKLVDSMLAKDPAARPQTARDVAVQLASFAKGSQLSDLADVAGRATPSVGSRPATTTTPPLPQPAGWWNRPVSRAKAIGLGLAGLLLGACLSIVVIITNPDGTRSILELAEGSRVEIREASSGEPRRGVRERAERTDPDLRGELPDPPPRPAAPTPSEQSLTPQLPRLPTDRDPSLADLPAFAETPLAFAVLADPRASAPAVGEGLSAADLEAAVLQLHEAQPSGSLTTPYGIWYPADDGLQAPFEANSRGRKFVLASLENRIDWPSIEGQVSSVMSSPFEFRLKLMPSLAEKMATLTRDNVGRHLAIIVNDRVMAAPRINSEIGDQVAITGKFQPGEARQLAQWLTAGLVDALPPPDRQLRLPPASMTPRAFPRTQPEKSNPDSASISNLRTLGVAFHGYYVAHQRLPASGNVLDPDATAGADQPRFSWRVALLPYLGEMELYQQFHFDEAWDSEHNAELLDKMPDVFRSPDASADQSADQTNYLALIGPRTMMGEEAGVRFHEVTDGLSNTILVIETSASEPWTKPVDLPYTQPEQSNQPLIADLQKIRLFADQPLRYLQGDGAVKSMPQPLDWELFAKLATRDGGEAIPQPLDSPHEYSDTPRPTRADGESSAETLSPDGPN